MKLYKASLYSLSLLLALTALLISATAFAQGAGFYTVTQEDLMVQITPLEGPVSAIDFYNLTANRSNTGFEEPNTAFLFLYRDPGTGETSLFVLLGGTGGEAGAASMTLSGVPAIAGFLVQDDALDFRDTWELTPPTAAIGWVWDEGMGDGMVLGPLGAEFDLTLFPHFIRGITALKFLSGDVRSPVEIELNLIDSILIKRMLNIPPEAAFTINPVEPRINEPITFDAGGSFDPDGTIVRYEWDFDGDGLFDLTTTDPVTTHSYLVSGTKSVTLRVTDEDGASASTTFAFYVSDLAVMVTRTISTAYALPGSTFKVVVRIEPEIDLAGAGLQESLPIGWVIKPVENAGAAFKRAEAQWVFVDQIRAGTTRVISYEVTIPSSAALIGMTLPIRLAITGTFQARTPKLEIPVEGDSEIEITGALPIKSAIAHLVPRIGDDVEDSIDLRLSQVITPVQLKRALEMWQNDEPVPWTEGATIDLKMMKALSAYAYTCTQVDLPLPLVPMANVTVVRTIATPLPFWTILLDYYDIDGHRAGNTFTVKVEIVADQDLYGVGLDEDLPTGWRVIPIEHDGFIFKRSRVEWIFPSKIPAGTMKTIIYQVEVPPSTALDLAVDDPCYVSVHDLFGRVNVALPCLDTVVIGDSIIRVSDSVSVIVAISRWDVERDRLDISLANKISFRQVQRAIAFWLEDEIVPRTAGRTVDYETLKTIIAHWLTNTDIRDPLPGVVRPPCRSTLLPCG